MKSVVIFGLGAIGALIAAQFSEANYPVDILCDIDRKEKYRQKGIIVNNKKYDFNYLTKEEFKSIPDLVIISLKYYHMREAIKQLDGLIGKKQSLYLF